MADRQACIDLCKGYVATGKQAVAAPIIEKLVDSIVRTISSKSRWTWRETKKDDYAFTPSVLTYECPANCVTILRIGELESGVIVQPYYAISEAYFTANYPNLVGISKVHYIPLNVDSTTKKRSFRLFPAVPEAVTGRMIYLRDPVADDIRYISNEMMIVYGMLGSMPNEHLSGDPKVDVAGRFYKLFTDELTSEVAKDEPSREIPDKLELPPRVQAVNKFLRNI